MVLGTDFTLGPFSVDAAGQLRPRKPDTTPGFTVRWRGHTLRARLGEGRLALEATLGRVPSSATTCTGPGTGAGIGPGPRERAFAALRTLPAAMPPSWRLCLAADHRVRIETEQPLETPPTAVRLVSEVTGFLLLLDPLLSRLHEAGLAEGAPPEVTA